MSRHPRWKVTNMGAEMNHASHWVSKVIDSDWPVEMKHPLLGSVVRFGSFPNIFFLITIIIQPSQVPQQFFVPMFLAVLWLNIGPALIWYYDERLLPRFFNELTEIFQDKKQLNQLAKKYDQVFSYWYWVPTLLWMALILALFFATQSFLATTGLFTVGGPFYYLYMISALWLGLFNGIGFMGVITTILAIRDVAKSPLQIDPIHPDNLGGLSVVGSYAIHTTLIFSSGSLLLPMSSIFLQTTNAGFIIYLIVVSYMGAIALSFLYPTYRINRQAQRIRDNRLDSLRKRYQNAKRDMKSTNTFPPNSLSDTGKESANRAKTNFENHDEIEELVGHLELQRIKNEYEDYQNVRLYPFKIDIIIKLVSSVLLPALFVLFDEALDFVL